MFLPGFGPRPCSYEVMAAAGCPRRRSTSLSQVDPESEDGWCTGQAAAAKTMHRSASFPNIIPRKNGPLLRGFIISVGVSKAN